MRNLGKTTRGEGIWRLQMLLQLLDRNANDKNKSKPLITKEWKNLYEKCSKFELENFVYYEDLPVSAEDFNQLKIPINKHKEALNNMIAIVQADPSRNRREYLMDYLRKNYGKKK